MLEWTEDERQIQAALTRLEVPSSGRIVDAKRILELANRAYSLYLTQNPAEQAKLLRLVLLNCAVDGVNVRPTYRRPFDLIFQRAKNEQWSALADDFRTFLASTTWAPLLPESLLQGFGPHPTT